MSVCAGAVSGGKSRLYKIMYALRRVGREDVGIDRCTDMPAILSSDADGNAAETIGQHDKNGRCDVACRVAQALL